MEEVEQEWRDVLAVHARVLAAALTAADSAGVRGKDVTPFLLDFFHRETQGASLRTNVALVRSNARLAAQIAVEFAAASTDAP